MNWIRATDDVDEQAKARLDEMADDGWLAQRCFRPRRMVAPIPLTDAQWRNLRVPTLLLAGDREVIFRADLHLPRVAALSTILRLSSWSAPGTTSSPRAPIRSTAGSSRSSSEAGVSLEQL